MSDEFVAGSDGSEEIAGALDALWDHMERTEPDASFGSTGMTPRDRRFSVLQKLRDLICPRSAEIMERVDSGEASVAAIVTDCALIYFVDLKYPATVLGREIARVGLARFCRDPGLVLQKPRV